MAKAKFCCSDCLEARELRDKVAQLQAKLKLVEEQHGYVSRLYQAAMRKLEIVRLAVTE